MLQRIMACMQPAEPPSFHELTTLRLKHGLSQTLHWPFAYDFRKPSPFHTSHGVNRRSIGSCHGTFQGSLFQANENEPPVYGVAASCHQWKWSQLTSPLALHLSSASIASLCSPPALWMPRAGQGRVNRRRRQDAMTRLCMNSPRLRRIRAVSVVLLQRHLDTKKPSRTSSELDGCLF